jgi:AraC family transcriptional regulator, exoenzyme S synthesis regulatory protein ExsA
MKKDDLQYNILYSCTDERKRGGEQLVGEHVLSYVISGEVQFFNLMGPVTYGPGQIGLLRKNLLLKSVKIPAADGRPFQSLNIFLDQHSLKKYSSQESVVMDAAYAGDAMLDMSHDVFIKGYFDSLVPYFTTDQPLAAGMAELKTREAIELVLRHNRKLKNLLFDFNEPFKIDLAAYMNQNYIYNIPITQFARLTGRSLATFKRDFRKELKNSPEKWLQKKRLEKAHFLISQQKQAPASVYIDVGFESLSHFSTSFKKLFGYNPSSL